MTSPQAPGESHHCSRRARATFRHSRPSRNLSCAPHKHRPPLRLVNAAVHWNHRLDAEIPQQPIPGTSSCLSPASAPPSALRRRSGASRHMTSKRWPQRQRQSQECRRRSIHNWWWLHADYDCQPRKSHSRCFNDIFCAWNVFAIDFIDEQPCTIIRIHIPSKFFVVWACARWSSATRWRKREWRLHRTLGLFHPILLGRVTKLLNTQRLLSPQSVHSASHYHIDYIHIHGISG